MAANAQGKFGAMNDKLFANSSALSRESTLQIAAEIGLDVKKFTNDIDTTLQGRHRRRGRRGHEGRRERNAGELRQRPFLSGAQPYEAFKKLIDEEIAKATK
jgi:predicted DsbA family dithiol-disulfide isomerase